jgi:hypothetical protein
VNNGTHTVNVSIPFAVGPDEAVTFTYSIVNSGHNKDEVEAALTTAITAAAAKAAAAGAAALGTGPIVSTVGTQAVSWLANKLGNFFFPNCDGTVAAANFTISEAPLAQWVAQGGYSQTDDNKGSSSPHFCNESNSRYYVTWSISGMNQTSGGGGGGGGGRGGCSGVGCRRRPN